MLEVAGGILIAAFVIAVIYAAIEQSHARSEWKRHVEMNRHLYDVRYFPKTPRAPDQPIG